MFRAITQANPDDYQSLEILKEAFWKIGQQTEGLAVTRQLADTYMRLGQYSSAMLEYEGILLHEPESPEVREMLAKLEEKLHQGKSMAPKASISLDFGVEEALATATNGQPEPSGLTALAPAPVVSTEPTLIATPATRMPKTVRKTAPVTLDNDGNEPLAKFLIQHRLASHDTVNSAVLHVRAHNASIQANSGVQAVAAGLLDEIIKTGVDGETLLSAIVDRTKFAFAPLEFYDIDRQIVKMLPEHLTLGRRIVPFDVVSRTMMVAIDNPFDTAAKAMVLQTVDYHIQWHLATPSLLHRILCDSYRIAG